ncbi:MAG: YraN family protein [Proteobacteria bacterium]|nr:YraN family protein [Pseudomonadota bacterium]
MLNIRQLFGKSGESLALSYLKKKGYRILETNYRNKMGEIDIIALDKDVIVFVEVKTRQSTFFSHPKEAVTVTKQVTMSRVAQAWLKSRNKNDSKARFDVVAILSDNNTHEIELIKNAFDLRSGT